jgi:hypothetical protein
MSTFVSTNALPLSSQLFASASLSLPSSPLLSGESPTMIDGESPKQDVLILCTKDSNSQYWWFVGYINPSFNTRSWEKGDKETIYEQISKFVNGRRTYKTDSELDAENHSLFLLKEGGDCINYYKHQLFPYPDSR